MQWLIILIALLAGCATAQTQEPQLIPAAQASPVELAGGLAAILIKDFAAAQKNFENAAARHPAGTLLNVRFTADAKCLADSAASLRGISVINTQQITGLISLGSVAVINAAELREQATSAASITSVNCDQVVGGIVRQINRDALQTVPSILLRGILP